MIERTLEEVVSMVGGIRATASCWSPDIPGLRGVSIDSRTVREGNLFIPIVRIDDGHRYVKQALDGGAVASLWQADHVPPPEDLPLIIVDDTLKALQLLAQTYRNQLTCQVIGVTGSNGKTTVKDMLASLLSTTYKVQKTIGNLNGEYGLPLTLLDVEEDTEFVVLEMGMSHAGEMKVLSEIARPDCGVITMIGVSHLSNLGSREAIASAKLELLEGLRPDGAIVIHGDEPLLDRALTAIDLPDALAVVRFGESPANDYFPAHVDHRPSGFSFRLNKHREALDIPLLGSHNVLNAVAAIAVAERYGINEQAIRSSLARLEITGMRMQRIPARRGFLIINDAWNASPVSMKAAIETVSNLDGFKKKVLVLGDMLELGDSEIAFHEEIARSIDTSRIHAVYTIGKLSRAITDALGESNLKETAKHFASKEALISACSKLLARDDLVLVKGSRSLKLEEVCEALRDAD